jgi:DNA invertase Pin-like site-specific DNA recombinase
MRVFGYARVSTKEQKIEPQVEAIKKYCNFKDYEIVNIYEDHASGKNIQRESFEAMMKVLGNGNVFNIDAIVIYKLDRIGRSLMDLMQLVKYYSDNNIGLIAVSENLDTTTKEGRLFLHFMGAMSEYERENILERTKLGRDHKMAMGYKWGRPEKKVDLEEIKRQLALGVPKSQIAKKFKVCRTTLYNKLEDKKVEKKVENHE